MKQGIFTAALLLLLFNPPAGAQRVQDLTGKWRGEFTLRENLKVPFNFEIAAGGMVYLLNAAEKFETGIISFKNDSLFIPLDQFDNELALQVKGNKLSGVLRKQDHTGTPLLVTAEKNKTHRFAESKNIPPKEISGSYNLEFTFESGKKEKSVAIFKQDGKKLTGTFLKESGDARYLEGITEGNKFYLSSFIGSSPGYYTGTVNDDGTIKGEQVGSRIRHSFKGKRDDNAALPDATIELPDDAREKLRRFSFPDIEGNIVSPEDEKYKNKVVIIPITGTWCPNCIDEAAFLSPWYKENRGRGVEIITIHYERQTDTAYYRKVMSRFRKRFDIHYDQVFGGISNSDTVRKSLLLPGFRAFPTTLFIDRKGRISKIHSGYSGPATGKFYEEFIREFNEEVDKLLRE
ncbi:MAG: TlpA family protein disulfide reductase [Chitinophagaceae bacterium]|nr:TlpA family protein disulfide reductase [Chitinophagaceae bacterium]